VTHRARKRFGQNFLVDSDIVRRIVEAIGPEPGQVILEIGPGEAALTQPLADSGAELHLLEIDRDLTGRLRDRFREYENVRVHGEDALRTDFAAITGNRRFRLVGNLPYNISTPLLFHVLGWSDRIADMHFMLQREVVRRMAAGPGGKARGKLSVTCQYRCEVTPLFDIPPESFRPAPKVHSTLVRLKPHARPPVAVDDPGDFDRLLSRAFSMRRKTLRNSLRELLPADGIKAAGIDPGLRPETLDLESWARLSNRLSRSDTDERIS
jgi:16S rRNA (adenine1518-N6/adenine1519-N6)-dimethyltransferase